MKAMIVDDEPMVLSLLQGVMIRRGYEVKTYTSPNQCPLYVSVGCPCDASETCPDVILTDFDMPQVTGVEFMEEVRRKGCTCSHVAMISGRWTESALRQAAPLGISVFEKPFFLPGLTAWLTEVERTFSSRGP